MRLGRPLSAALFGLFIDGLHHYLESAVPAAGLALCVMRLRGLVCADNAWLLVTNSTHLKALVDALGASFGMLHMELSAMMTKLMPLFGGGCTYIYMQWPFH